VLMFKVASLDIGYNCIIEKPFLLKFMTVIYTAYDTLKMPSPKGVITIKADQCDALACENATLTHDGRFDEKAAQDQAAKIVSTHNGSTSFKSLAPKPSTVGSPRPPSAKKGMYDASVSNQRSANHPTDVKKKEVDDKEVLVDPNNLDKKLRISIGLEAK
jgi:hypothetical protein